MNLSFPIYVLKRKAKLHARNAKISLTQALDSSAQKEGFKSWSHLAAQYAMQSPARRLFHALQPGDMLLLGARPGQGKTLLSLELLVEALNSGNCGLFFTLEDSEIDVADRLSKLGYQFAINDERFKFYDDDLINADYIEIQLSKLPAGTVAVIDYLQLLDQRRENDDLLQQVKKLKSIALKRGVIIVCLSQIDRSFRKKSKGFPGLEDVRLPNPLDLALFNKTCFLNGGVAQIDGRAI